MYPLSMSMSDRNSLADAMGQLAADRANGAVKGAVSADHLTDLFRQHGYQDPAARADAQGRQASVDLLT